MTIRLHIERLVIEGLPAGSPERAGLGQAIERELTALLAEAGFTGWQAGHHPVLRRQDLRTPGLSLGQQIARSTVQAITSQEVPR